MMINDLFFKKASVVPKDRRYDPSTHGVQHCLLKSREAFETSPSFNTASAQLPIFQLIQQSCERFNPALDSCGQAM